MQVLLEGGRGDRRSAAVLMTLYRSDPLNFFEQAMRSIETQEFEGEVRIYLCVDGPIPETHEVWLSENIHRFFLVVRNETNIGLARSLNKLIEKLGDETYVFRMDGDDISLPGRFNKQVAFLEEHELDIIGCQSQDIDDSGRVTAKRNFPMGDKEIRASLHKANPILHPTFCLRRDVFRDEAIRYPDAYLCEDLALLILIARGERRFGNHPDVLFQWRSGAAFYERRQGFKRGWTEMKWYLTALKDSGRLFSPGVVFPFARLALRCFPVWAIKMAYASKARARVHELA